MRNLILSVCTVFLLAFCSFSSMADLPTGWSNGDVGSPGITGTGSENSGTFTLEGTGEDIYHTADEFQYAYYYGVYGDCSITARIVSIENKGWSNDQGITRRRFQTCFNALRLR